MKYTITSIVSFTHLLLILFSTSTFAVEIEDLKKANKNALSGFSIIQQKNADIFSLAAPGIPAADELRIITRRTDDNGVAHTRYQQFHHGVPVMGKQALIHTKPDGSIRDLGGQLVHGIQQDIKSLTTRQNSFSALSQARKYHETANPDKGGWQYENERSELVIFVNDNNKAQLAFHVSYFAVGIDQGKPVRPHYVLDARTLKILRNWDGLTHLKNGTGPGGNLKTGAYEYGTNPGFLDITQNANNTVCQLENANVSTVNLNHGYFRNPTSPAHNFACFRNTVKQINGAYSPLNDAHYFGGEVYNMFQSWYNMPPLNFQLRMYVHYLSNYENAFWDGRSMTFGDGRSRFYPLVSLDVVAHEVAHGFTEQNSGLIYRLQSGGINEAFSDMAGKAAEFYSRGANNWKLGFDIFKAPNKALRYMDYPPLDGRSIDHMVNYYPGLDVHYSSGIYNKAFYLMASTQGWNTKKAFDTMVNANMNYWSPSVTFAAGSCGVFAATTDLDYNAADVVTAFNQVGVSCDTYTGLAAPTISLIDPASMSSFVGENIELLGENFCHFQCTNLIHNTETQVAINGLPAQIVDLRDETEADIVVIIIPDGATSGPITVTTPAGTAVGGYFTILAAN